MRIEYLDELEGLKDAFLIATEEEMNLPNSIGTVLKIEKFHTEQELNEAIMAYHNEGIPYRLLSVTDRPVTVKSMIKVTD